MEKEIRSFRDLETWRCGHQFAIQIYKITKNFPKDELFGVISQLRRAASSITANVAEGFARYHFNDKIRFYYQARGSAAEVQNFLSLSKDLGYIDDKSFEHLDAVAMQVLKLINGLIRSADRQNS